MNKLRCIYTFIIFLGIFFLSPILLIGQTTVRAAVVINEIFPKTTDVTLEWIELYNTGSESVSLNQWTLANTVGTTKTFILNASNIISSHGYLTFYQPQTGITFNTDGDTVRLTDDKNNVVDSQSYLGTLGYNTSMGRSPDGSSSWTICNTATPNKTNDCPVATPTQTPIPTPTTAPTDTPIPTATEIPVPTDTPQGLPVYQPPEMMKNVPGIATTPTLTPTPQDTLVTIHVPNTIPISKKLAIQIAVVAGSWIVLALIAFLRRKPKPHR